ncbi:hypothetical protein PoB_005764700 [Plakobranchus ocellatus]|uniref:Uncharacterized protein n=1 Tax=Plakobranchus ocellatus TaxID=259542 RepID=A0AAV4CII0_9GAST|nr:hypothetical protein PoB_005764700 [Plakobranchus ocellatus]
MHGEGSKCYRGDHYMVIPVSVIMTIHYSYHCYITIPAAVVTAAAIAATAITTTTTTYNTSINTSTPSTPTPTPLPQPQPPKQVTPIKRNFKMADDEEFDFFKPHPNPKPRVKTSFFEVVPDAYDDKSLTFTGDHRRTPKKVVEEPKAPDPEPEPEPEKEEPAAAMTQPALQDTMFAHDICMTSAEPWSPGDRLIWHSGIESALRSAGTLLSRVRALPSAPRPDGGL